MKYQKESLSKFPNQIHYALNLYSPHWLKQSSFDNILLCGLGGSGISGRIAKNFFYGSCTLPIEVVSDYNLPAYTGKRTLVILGSYSGTTEETLSMYDEAKAKGSTIISISTGGELAEKAIADGFKNYYAEKGFQPRMALGYSLSFLLLIFEELTGIPMKKDLLQCAVEFEQTDKYIQAGENLFNQIKESYPCKIAVMSDRFSNPIGLRFCQQIQENAKDEAFLHELPENNHNVTESYYGKLNSIFLFLDSNVHPRTHKRFLFMEELLKKQGNLIVKFPIAGNSLFDLLSSIYTLDWLSLWLADYKGVNSEPVPNIQELKNFLANN